MDESFTLLNNASVVFDDKIIEVSNEDLRIKYPDAQFIKAPPNACLMPGLINAHTHLEYCVNKTDLRYGNFLLWLGSVMDNRAVLQESCTQELMQESLREMLSFGITTIGEISSFGSDLDVCVKSPMRVVFFNELIGSDLARENEIMPFFKTRLETSMKQESQTFIPAISIHSPYSVHQQFVQEAVNIAKKHNMRLSTHFMESEFERKWLDTNKGEFEAFFNKYISATPPINNPQEFLHTFDDTKTTYVHCVHANDDELDIIEAQDASIVHCPISNRLLGVGRLDLERLKNATINFALATDGLSSNYTTNIFDELRTALMIHYDLDIKLLAKDLLKGVTSRAAKALDLDLGEISVGKKADLALFELPDKVDEKNIAYELILHIKNAHSTYINGEKI